jgi:opacity protein-like surface antigen
MFNMKNFNFMKKQIFLSLIFCFAFGAASFAQSKLFLGADLGFSSNDHHSSFALSPRLGYWLSDNGAIVGGITFGSNKDKTTNPDTESTVFGVGAQYRMAWHSGDNFYFYLAPGVEYLSSKLEFGGTDATTSILGISLSPGISYMLADKWSVNAELGLIDFTSTSPEVGDSETDFSVNMNMSSLTFGLWYHF